MSYSAWRITYQDSEQAAKAAFKMATELRTDLGTCKQLLDGVNTVLGASKLLLDSTILERDELRAELEKPKDQKPFGYVSSTNTGAVSSVRLHKDCFPVYLAPGAQPVPEGMVLVPIVLTEKMLEKLAYMGRSRVVSGANKSDWEPAAIRNWKSILEAAKDKS